MKTQNASALIPGGASGLGEATARRLHSRGFSVVIADLNADKGEALAAELGSGAHFVLTDVADAEQVEAAVETALDCGELRVSVACAGIGKPQRTVTKTGPHDIDLFSQIVGVNLIGTFNVLRLAATAMVENDPDDGERGVCINTASIAAFDGQVGQVAYAASKAGVVGLTLPAARDLAGRGVRVVTIAPGLFDTPILAAVPLEQREKLGAGIPFPPRLGRPNEFATFVDAVIDNRMLNGATIRLDGALRLAPK